MARTPGIPAVVAVLRWSSSPRDSFEIGMVSRIGAGEAGVYELVQQLLITDAMGDRIEPLMSADQVRGRWWADSNGLLKPSH